MLEVYFNTAAWILLTCLCLGELWILMACWNLTFPELSSPNTDIIFFSFLLRNWIESYVFPGYIIFSCNLQLFVTSFWIDSHSNTKSLHGNIGRDQAKSCQALKGPVLDSILTPKEDKEHGAASMKYKDTFLKKRVSVKHCTIPSALSANTNLCSIDLEEQPGNVPGNQKKCTT